jgi:hypothetical protein
VNERATEKLLGHHFLGDARQAAEDLTEQIATYFACSAVKEANTADTADRVAWTCPQRFSCVT